MTWRPSIKLFDRPARLLRLIRAMGLAYPYNLAVFFLRHWRFPNFQRTGYINDLLFDIKIKDENDVARAFTSDKEFVKIYAQGVLGEDLCVPTLGVLRSEAEVDAWDFPVPCVVKPTHMSQQIIFLTSAPTDCERGLMKKWFRINYSDLTLEGNYRHLEPKIIVEPFIRFNNTNIIEYRFYAYRGKTRIIELIHNRSKKRYDEYYTSDWRRIDIKSIHAKNKPHDLAAKPKRIEDMVEIAKKLAANFDFIRVDLYTDGEDIIYLGELTHIAADARIPVLPAHTERYFTADIPAEAIIA